jgi:hypothetical protein
MFVCLIIVLQRHYTQGKPLLASLSTFIPNVPQTASHSEARLRSVKYKQGDTLATQHLSG